jgi:probable F420-dependent oxidoreductase
MRLDFQTLGEDLGTVPRVVGMAEAAGYDGYWTAETQHDPFLPHVLAAEHSERIELGTGIAVAFARNPMTIAHTAWDLQAMSAGRFILGLGSQIKPHITMRFSMPWSRPAARMKEFVQALHAIWDAWETGERLQFRGEFYTHALMTPFFSPGPIAPGRPKVFIAGVGRHMIRVAGEVCDGLLAHGFSTVRYAEEVIVPTIDAALAASGRDRSRFELSQPVFVVTGADQREMARSKAVVKQQIAFYGSTPAYRSVLEHHGWGDLQDELNAMSKRGEWTAMGDLITDEILDAFAVSGEPYQAGAGIKERYGHIADRVSFYTKPDGYAPEVMAEMIRGVRS